MSQAERTIEIIEASKARTGESTTLEMKITAVLAYKMLFQTGFIPSPEIIMMGQAAIDEIYDKQEKMFITLISTLAPGITKDPQFMATFRSIEAAMENDLKDIKTARKARGQ